MGGRVVVPGDTVEVQVTARTSSNGKPKASACFEGSLKFSCITHSHAVIPPHPALDLDNDFTIELWLRLAAGAARDGRAKCAWSVVFADGELATHQQRLRSELDVSSSSSISSSSAPLSQRRRQRQRERHREQQDVPRTVRRAISFSDAAGSQHGDNDDATSGDDGPNTEGGWSTEGPITTGDALAREGSIMSRAAAARRATLPSLSLEPSVTRRAVDEAAFAQLQSMGFPRDTALRSLEVARNDVRQAVEFCTNGIPNERLFISRGADALRLMARRAALAEGLAETGFTTPSALSSPSSSTTSPASSSFPTQRPGNRLTQLHTYIARLNNQGADESCRIYNSPTSPATKTLTSTRTIALTYRPAPATAH